MSGPSAPPHVQHVLDQFDHVRPSGNGWSARCPAHKDTRNSLSIGIGDNGSVVLGCKAGCETGMVLYHKGLTFKDLYPPRTETVYANGHSRRPSEPPPSQSDDAPPERTARVIKTTRYEIRTTSGELRAFHPRTDYGDGTKSVWYELPDGTKGLGGMPKADLPLYGIHALGDTKIAIVCEGEKAADALRDLGIAAVGTVTGADGCPCDDSLRPLLGLQVGLWSDNDEVGHKHMDRLGTALRRLGQPANALYRIDWPDAPEKGDGYDYVARGGTRESFRELVKSAPLWEPAADAHASSPGSSTTGSRGTAASPGAGGLTTGNGPSQATLLVGLARKDDSELFHDPAGSSFITFALNGHRENWPLASRTVRDWLSRRFYEAYETSPGGDALKNALTTLGGIATFDGLCRDVFVRLAGHEGAIYLDLGNAAWEVARIRDTGWDVIPAGDAPVRFRRPRGLLPLPTPEPGGHVTALRGLINVKDEAAFTLIVAWLLGALNPRGTYALLVLSGEQGSAKTTAARILRACIDPNVAALRSVPREEGDVLIAATNGLVVGYDNLSTLPDWLSDALCRLTSGGGLSKRALYTDVDEVVLDARRPALLTGIESVLSRGDAIDRALLVELHTISKGQRRTDEEVWGAFELARPGILGALLDAASAALQNLPNTHIADLPRLADFTRWVEAGAPAFGWEPGDFLGTYNGNRDNADEIAVEASPIGPTLLAYLDGLGDSGEWQGTASELLAALNTRVADDTKKARDWPKRANSVSGQVKRLAPHLRRLGFGVQIGEREGHEGRRIICLSKRVAKECQHRQHRQQAHDDADFCRRSPAAASSASSAASSAHHPGTDSENPRHYADFPARNRRADDADDADDDLHASGEDGIEASAPADCPKSWECGVRGPCPGYGENGCPLAASRTNAQAQQGETWQTTPLMATG